MMMDRNTALVIVIGILAVFGMAVFYWMCKYKKQGVKKMDWKVNFDSYEKQNTMPLDRAKIEALRRIAEELEILNANLIAIRGQIGKM